jgi:putative phosphoesterase
MPAERKTITLGVIADTHIPDRVRQIPTGILDGFRQRNVDQIIHAGDACNWHVVKTLEEIAPVTIIQGNRDWLLGMRLPRNVEMTINDIQITVAHGHHSIINYIFYFLYAKFLNRYDFDRYYRLLIKDFPQADLIIFGHTHFQTAKWVDDQLLFNPGAAYPCKQNHFHPQYGIISITPDGVIRTEFHTL